MDLVSATDRGIRVCNTPGVNHGAVAEMTIALMLISARRLTAVIDGVRAGGWPRDAGTELRGTTLAIIGFGPSGRAVANLATAFGMTVLVHTAHPDPTATRVQFVDRDTAFTQADYLSLHTRSDDRTRRMIDASALAAMKPTAVLINTARGSLIDEDALADALDSGQIAGAALDVLDAEPMPAESRLRGRHDVIVTSHLAGQTAEARLRAGLCAAADVIAVLDGREPAHPVN